MQAMNNPEQKEAADPDDHVCDEQAKRWPKSLDRRGLTGTPQTRVPKMRGHALENPPPIPMLAGLPKNRCIQRGDQDAGEDVGRPKGGIRIAKGMNV